MLVVSSVGVVLFFVFSPEKKEEGSIDYIHYEIPSPVLHFNSEVVDSIYGTPDSILYKRRKLLSNEEVSVPKYDRKKPWIHRQITARVRGNDLSRTNQVLTRTSATSVPDTTVTQPSHTTKEPDERRKYTTGKSSGSSSTSSIELVQSPVTPTTDALEVETIFPTLNVQNEGHGDSSSGLALVPMSDRVESDCSAHLANGKGSGIYLIAADGVESLPAYCDQETAGGGWTVIQRRVNEAVYFYNRTWSEYEQGFGDLEGSFWFGLEKVSSLVTESENAWILRIELHGDHCTGSGCLKRSNEQWWAEWPFKLGDASTMYELELGTVIDGNLTRPGLPDLFQQNNRCSFSTIDSDNDGVDTVNCALFRNYGGWWHNQCGSVALNGKYVRDNVPVHRYMSYVYENPIEKVRKTAIHPKKTLMMIRPVAAG